MDIHTPSNLAGSRRIANRWIRLRMGQLAEGCGKGCIVRDIWVAVKAVLSFVDPPEANIIPY